MRRWTGFAVATLLAVLTAVWVGLDAVAARSNLVREKVATRTATIGQWAESDGVALRVTRFEVAEAFPDLNKPEREVHPTAEGAVIVRVSYEIDRRDEQSVSCRTALFAGLGRPDQQQWEKGSLAGLASFDDPSYCGWKPSDGSPRPAVITLVEGFEVPPGTRDLTFQLGRDTGARVLVPLSG